MASNYTGGTSISAYNGVSSSKNHAIRVRAKNSSGTSGWTGSLLVWYVLGSGGGASGGGAGGGA